MIKHTITVPCVKEDFKSMPEMLEHIKSCIKIEFGKLKIRKKKEATIHFSKRTDSAIIYIVKEVIPAAAKERNYGFASDPKQKTRKSRSKQGGETDWGEVCRHHRRPGHFA
jgi:hypothetical protein